MNLITCRNFRLHYIGFVGCLRRSFHTRLCLSVSGLVTLSQDLMYERSVTSKTNIYDPLKAQSLQLDPIDPPSSSYNILPNPVTDKPFILLSGKTVTHP